MNRVEHSIWYKEPWVWFSHLLLIAMIISGIVLVIIAFKHAPAEVNSEWYRSGVLITQHRVASEEIQSLGLASNVIINSQTHRIEVNITRREKHRSALSDQKLFPAQLTLYIEHPTIASLDETVHLIKQGATTYTGKTTTTLTGKRYLLITNSVAPWQLAGQGYFPNNAILHLN